MNGSGRFRWCILLGLLAAVVTCSISAIQHTALAMILWRGIVAFATVWAFHWSLLSAWDILGDDGPIQERSRVRRGEA